MIRALSHSVIYVSDYDEAIAFYTEKLGFELRNDVTLEGFRWVTVGPMEQKDHEMVLMVPAPSPFMDADTVASILGLLQKGALGAGVFTTSDCKGTYEALKERGVSFMSEPAERPYGVEAILRDNSGNWFSLTEPR